MFANTEFPNSQSPISLCSNPSQVIVIPAVASHEYRFFDIKSINLQHQKTKKLSSRLEV